MKNEPFAGVWRNRKVLITGHTGFKGSWLALWLHQLGANVSGLALPARPGSHWDALQLDLPSHLCDLRDEAGLKTILQAEKPDFVFHLAAQALVRESYRSPLETLMVNVNGTANLLEAVRQTDSVQAVVVVTSDKCYANREWSWGYRESDRLGGKDPYSASKACAELITASWRDSFFSDGALLATVRAGNVIGGGDWSEDRLLPDLARAASKHQALGLRYPNALRPWQHVLDPLAGYLMLGQRLIDGDRSMATAFNFGPVDGQRMTVGDVARRFCKRWPLASVTTDSKPHDAEAGLLWLDSTRAQALLGWQPIWTAGEAIDLTADWYRLHWEMDGDPKRMAEHSLTTWIRYCALAQEKGALWA